MPDIVPILASDVEDVARFLAHFPDEKDSADAWLKRMRAWWDLNPAFQSDSTRGWLLRDEGTIVGMLGNIPLDFQHGGRSITVHAGTTWRVLPSHRGLSMALKQRQMRDQRESLHFSTTPAPQVVALLKVLRYRRVTDWQGDQLQSVMRFRFDAPIRRKLGNFPFSRPLSWLSAQALALRQRWNLRAVKERGVDVAVQTSADGSFDELWSRTRSTRENTNARTSAWVQWYCFVACPERKTLIACRKGERLLGYMILLDERIDGRSSGRCIDVWMDPASAKNVLSALLNHCRVIAKKTGWELLVFPHFSDELGCQYRELGLELRPAWDWKAFVHGPAHLLDPMTKENTYFTAAQGDLGL